jgi:hypothetical protein
MHEELNNFTRNQVWELVERPKNYNVISQWHGCEMLSGSLETSKIKMAWL